MTCPFTGKRGWTDKAAAKSVGAAQPTRLYAFHCDSCGYWHLGSKLGLPREVHRRIHGQEAS